MVTMHPKVNPYPFANAANLFGRTRKARRSTSQPSVHRNRPQIVHVYETAIGKRTPWAIPNQTDTLQHNGTKETVFRPRPGAPATSTSHYRFAPNRIKPVPSVTDGTVLRGVTCAFFRGQYDILGQTERWGVDGLPESSKNRGFRKNHRRRARRLEPRESTHISTTPSPTLRYAQPSSPAIIRLSHWILRHRSFNARPIGADSLATKTNRHKPTKWDVVRMKCCRDPNAG